MITSVNLKPNRSNIWSFARRCDSALRCYYSKDTTSSWKVPGGLAANFDSNDPPAVSSMQKVVRVHYLSFARDGTKFNGLHNPLHILSFRHWCSLSTPAGFVSLAQWASSRLRGRCGFDSCGIRCLRAKTIVSHGKIKKFTFHWVNIVSVYVDSGRWRAAYASVSIDGFRPVFFIWSGERTNVYHKEIWAS